MSLWVALRGLLSDAALPSGDLPVHSAQTATNVGMSMQASSWMLSPILLALTSTTARSGLSFSLLPLLSLLPLELLDGRTKPRRR